MKIKSKKMLVVLAVLAIVIFIAGSFLLYVKTNRIRQLTETLNSVTSQLNVNGFIQQESIAYQEHRDLYGLKRVLLAEVANYYSNSTVTLADLENELKKIGWSDKSTIITNEFCVGNRKEPNIVICIEILDKPDNYDMIGGGDDQLWPTNNYRKLKQPYNLKISAVDLHGGDTPLTQ